MNKKYLISILALFVLVSMSACQPKEVDAMPYELEYQNNTYAGKYTGTVQKKLPHGEGTFSYSDGENDFTYNGGWNEGKMSGNGELTASQFLISFTEVDRWGSFEGDTKNGIPNGSGTFTAVTNDGEKYCYTGEFSKGIFNGHGERRFENDPSYDEIGTFTNGEYTPTVPEVFAYFGQEETATFSIGQKSSDFLSSHPNLFTSNSQEGLDAFVDTEYRREIYTKSPDKYGDKLIKLTPLNIIQISEYGLYNYENVTYILAEDSNYNIYYIYYLGSADVYEGDNITAYLLPLNFFTYESVSGNEIWAIACAAAYVE